MACLTWVTHLIFRTVGAARGRAARGHLLFDLLFDDHNRQMTGLYPND